MEMIEIDIALFMQVIDMALKAAFYTCFFGLGLIIGFAIVATILGNGEDE